MKTNWFNLNFNLVKIDLVEILYQLNSRDLRSFSNLLSIGAWCKDCDKFYISCLCNEYLSINVFNWIPKNLSVKNINTLINKLKTEKLNPNEFIIEYLEYCKNDKK